MKLNATAVKTKSNKNISVSRKIIFFVLFFICIIFAEPVEIRHVEVFQNVLKQPNKLLVFDLYADWCKPCKMLDPILRDISKDNKEVQFYRVNIDSLPQIQQAFQAQSIPFVAFFKNGQYLDRLIGLHPKENYLKAIEILNNPDTNNEPSKTKK